MLTIYIGFLCTNMLLVIYIYIYRSNALYVALSSNYTGTPFFGNTFEKDTAHGG